MKHFSDIIDSYANSYGVKLICEHIQNNVQKDIQISGLAGSSLALVAASVFKSTGGIHIVILTDRETASYFYNDLEALLDEQGQTADRRKVLFFPTAYRKSHEMDQTDGIHTLMRAEILNRISAGAKRLIVVTYPEALSEKVMERKLMNANMLRLHVNEAVSIDFIMEVLAEYNFERVDFVTSPGQFALRGGICDVFSYAGEYPYRIEFAGDTVSSIRSFEPENQLSIQKLDKINILPDIQSRDTIVNRQAFPAFLPHSATFWLDDPDLILAKIEQEYLKAIAMEAHGNAIENVSEFFIGSKEFGGWIDRFIKILRNAQPHNKENNFVCFNCKPQPAFSKNFDLLFDDLLDKQREKVSTIIVSENPKQINRLQAIFEDMESRRNEMVLPQLAIEKLALHEGFIDEDAHIAIYTDHQIFQRYQKYKLHEKFSKPARLNMQDFFNLQPGDYVVHINHGIGRYAGLEKIEVNGKLQEAIKLVYKDKDALYVSIHALHRISRYVGKDGAEPKVDRLGSQVWQNQKNKAKKKVKDIARDLIKLYASRRAAEGFQFSPDTYLQTELEASFIYEDTPDQEKATRDVKTDMEASFPMDRLICGDVGFGKTEIAIRAAFKAVADSKQVAVLVPTTILALQHYRTFNDRLKDLPCRVEYLNRFRSTQKQKEVLKLLVDGRIDVLIGTHRLISKDVKFKELGLLVIDEEQKFGVGAKEKLRQMKENVDTLTLTATPIPRTLQFSLMGARDLSIIRTPPPNRFPVQTEVRTFHPDIIKEAIDYEIERSGQVFLVHNRIQNIQDVASMVHKLVPKARIGVAHGQMEGHEMEDIMLDFIEGNLDVLVSTTIVESGLDVPNANTMIINDAQNFGLSELHQLRGRVGRSNRKAFCFLITPPFQQLSEDARKRLRAIEEFSDLGSGFNIAMRDLDIRGAGNLLGAEQSGFITDIGYEMYQKILDEALHELKTDEFGDVYAEDDGKPVNYVRDVNLETDMSLLIPDQYVSSIAERLILYKDLNAIETNEGLDQFTEMLRDRFGEIPVEAVELLRSVKLRWLARQLGMEKLVLKRGELIAYFIGNHESAFFQSPGFKKVLDFVLINPRICRMKEQNNKLMMAVENIHSVSDAIMLLASIVEDYNV